MTTSSKFILSNGLVALCSAASVAFLQRFDLQHVHALSALSGLLIALVFSLGWAVHKQEKVKKDHAKFFQTLLNTIPSPIFYKDAAGRYLGGNRAFEAYVGLSQQQFVGKTVHELWSKELADKYWQQDRVLFQNPGSQVYEASVDYADGSRRNVVFNKATFEGVDGSLGGLVGVILDVTERRQAEDELAFRNAILKTQQEASPDGILVVDDNDRIISWNQRFARIMRVPSKLLEKGDDAAVLELVHRQVVDPQQFLEKVRYLYAHRDETCSDEIVLRGGKILDRYSAPMHGVDGRYYGRLWTFRDITKRKAAEEATKSAYQQMLNIVEFLPDATFVIDRRKRVIAWNQAMEKMTGVKKREILGKGDYAYAVPFYGVRTPILIDFLADEECTLDPNQTYGRKEGDTLFAQCALPPVKGQEPRFVSSTASPLFDNHGNQVGSIQSIRDLTEMKRVEKEKARLEVQLQHSSLMQSLMIRLGHDLKTPLTPLTTLLPLMEQGLADPGLARMAHICRKNAQQLGELIEKTLNFSNLSSLLCSAKRESILLAPLLEELVAGVTGEVGCEIAVPPELAVWAEPGQLKQLFDNLLTNAVRHSNKQGVVRITALQTDAEVTVSVRDEGTGLAPEHLERVFEEFYKVDESRHDLAAFGLGLSVCKRIVLNHQGRIWAESPGIGQGTTIWFSLPVNLV
jgi:PAS domain S-box-containing protein